MENERELLELAANASGIKIIRSRLADPLWRDMLIENRNVENDGNPSARWRPHVDDGDCARMEAALGINVKWFDVMGCVNAWVEDSGLEPENATDYEFYADHNGEKQAARRMASLRVAAEVGRAMQSDKR